ncbi:hypothetical protein [Azospirillum sp. ST 5-10]|uniref:hypothetical protein n=1 Tax=unclassified Azospirillum TaxID=2630922 RepID=UPI003F4A7569
MTLKEFKHYTDLYGGDLRRWPDSRAADAATLLATSDEAAAILAEAVALDGLLDTAAPRVSAAAVNRVAAGIAARIDAAPARRTPPWFMVPPPVRLWPAAGVLAVSALAGFLVVSQAVLPLATATMAGPQGLSDVLVAGGGYWGTIQ